MDARSIILKLRGKNELTQHELTWFAAGLADGSVTDAQAGAFAMAAVLNGMTGPECVALTLAMRDTGDVLKWDLPGPTLDKHSTGGLGDCTSLLLAPALAALGAYVPMISGRGLGHTGGTLDKLEAIAGLNTEVSREKFTEIVSQVGCAVVSATGDIAPADKRLYAVRDVTGTVESIDLITASILSKKLAVSPDALVLDAKCGSGAFMGTLQDARLLAQRLVETANGAGCATSALITDMNQPCCDSLGNALEIMEVMRALTSGDAAGPLCDLTCALGGEALVLGGLGADREAAQAAVRDVLKDGSAAERFGKMVTALGGPADFVSNWRDRLPAAPVVRDVFSAKSGYVSAMDGRKLGMVVVHLGGGRLRGDERIDPAVGISNMCRLGDLVTEDVVLATIHARTPEMADAAESMILSALEISNAPQATLPQIYERIEA